MKEEGVHGGGSHNEWEFVSAGNLHTEVHKNDTKGPSNKVREKDALQVANQNSPNLTTVDGGKHARNGARPITLKSNNPVLEAPIVKDAAPPKGAGGTGNPFFNINPMAIFFEEFLKMMTMQKQTELVTNKLAVTDAKLIIGMAQDQANAIVKEADVQATSLRQQAAMQFTEAGVNAVMTGATIVGGVMARKELNEERNVQAKTTKDAENSLHATEEGAPEMTQLQKSKANLAAKDDMLGKTDEELASKRALKSPQSESEELSETHNKDEISLQEEGTEELDTVKKNKSKMNKLKEKQKITEDNLNHTKSDLLKKDKAIKAKDQEILETEQTIDKGDNTPATRAKLTKLKAEKDQLISDKQTLENKRDELVKVKNKQASEFNKIDEENNFLTTNKTNEKKLENINKKLAQNDEALEADKKWLKDNPNGVAKNQKAAHIKELETENAQMETERNQLLNDRKNKLKASKAKDEADVVDKQKALDNNEDVKKAKAKYEAQQEKLQEMDKTGFKNNVESLQHKPWYMAMSMGKDTINTALEAGSKLAQANGQVKAAAWEAMKTRIAGYQQIMQAAMQAMTSAQQDSYSQANDLAQTLIKMSDQEQQSMHWA